MAGLLSADKKTKGFTRMYKVHLSETFFLYSEFYCLTGVSLRLSSSMRIWTISRAEIFPGL